MPLLIVGVDIAEPPTAPRARNCGRMMAWLVVRRHRLTEMVRDRAIWFFIFHYVKRIHPWG